MTKMQGLAFAGLIGSQYLSRGLRQVHCTPNHDSKIVPPTIHLGPPDKTPWWKLVHSFVYPCRSLQRSEVHRRLMESMAPNLS